MSASICSSLDEATKTPGFLSLCRQSPDFTQRGTVCIILAFISTFMNPFTPLDFYTLIRHPPPATCISVSLTLAPGGSLEEEAWRPLAQHLSDATRLGNETAEGKRKRRRRRMWWG